MKRIGKYSGKFYNENEVNTMTECGVVVSEEKLKDEKFMKELKFRNMIDCAKCMGCPMAN